MRTLRRVGRIVLALTVLLLLLMAPRTSSACPTCSRARPIGEAGVGGGRGGLLGAAATHSEQLSREDWKPGPGDYSLGINLSILFLIGTVYIVLGTFLFVMFRMSRAREEGAPLPVPGGAGTDEIRGT